MNKIIKKTKTKQSEESLSDYLIAQHANAKSKGKASFILMLIPIVVILYAMFQPVFSEQERTIAKLDKDYRAIIDSLIKNNLLDEKSDTLSRHNVYIEEKSHLLDQAAFTFFRFLKFIFFGAIFVGILSYVIYYRWFKTIYFHCSDCYKIIYVHELPKMKCPACGRSKSIMKLLNQCECNTKLKYYKCPHCNFEIDFFKPYSEKKIKDLIYDS